MAEIERLAGDDRFVQVLLPGTLEQGLGNRRYWPILRAAAEAGLPVALHTGGNEMHKGAGWPSYYLEMHVWNGNTMAMQMLSMICSGVFEEIPGLQMVSVETGIAWAAALSWSMDDAWRMLNEGDTTRISEPPSHYLRENWWFTTQPIEEPDDPEHLALAFDALGMVDRIMFSSDYPHWDFDAPSQTLPRSISREDKDEDLRGQRLPAVRPPAPMTVATQVVDVDVHVAPQTVEPLLSHMEPYWADYVANAELRLSPTMNGLYPPVAFLAGEEEGTVQPVPATLDELRAGLGDDRMAVLNCVTPFDSSHNVYYEAALCSGVNDWLRTEFLERDPRLRASLLVPTLDPDAAVEEIERLGSHPGFVQILLPIRTEAPWGNKRFHRLHDAAVKHGLVLGLHAWGRVGNAPTTSGFTTSYLEDYATNSQIVAQAHVTSLVSEGCFERTPELRVAMLECGFTWLPFLLWRFDKDWKGVWREVPWVKERPSAYVLRGMRFSTAPAALPADPAVLARLPDLMPVADLLMYASDHPHRHGGTVEPLLEVLGEDARQAILSGNASSLYGL